MINLNPRYALIAACLIGLAGCKLESSTTIAASNIKTTVNTDVLVPVTLEHTGDNTDITNIRVSTNAPTLVSQQSTTCPAKLKQNEKCVVTLKFNSPMVVPLNRFEVVVKYSNTRGEQTINPNLTIYYTVNLPPNQQQTFLRYGSFAPFINHTFYDLGKGSFLEFSAVGTTNRRTQVDPITGETLRNIPTTFPCARARSVDANGTCIVALLNERRVTRQDSNGNVLFDYDYTYPSDFAIEIVNGVTTYKGHRPFPVFLADGSAVIYELESATLVPSVDTPTKYSFYNSSGQLMFQKTGPQYVSGIPGTTDRSYLLGYDHVKQVKDSAGVVYYTVSGNGLFTTYDTQGKEVCSGKPPISTSTSKEWVMPVGAPPSGSDKPTSQVHYLSSGPVVYENGLPAAQQNYTTRTLTSYDMLTCQQTTSVTQFGLFNYNPYPTVYEFNDKILDFLGNYYDLNTQQYTSLDQAAVLALLGPVSFTQADGVTAVPGVSIVLENFIPWNNTREYLFDVSFYGQGLDPTDTISMMGKSFPVVASSGVNAGFTRVWGVARLNANGTLEVSKAINSAN